LHAVLRFGGHEKTPLGGVGGRKIIAKLPINNKIGFFVRVRKGLTLIIGVHCQPAYNNRTGLTRVYFEMEDADLRKAGADFSVGEDLYGISLAQLRERVEVLRAEITRIEAEIGKKGAEMSAAEDFFKKT
jgi:uncharacterized small protein (DUF1192 family)